jgi:hypothetical protein
MDFNQKLRIILPSGDRRFKDESSILSTSICGKFPFALLAHMMALITTKSLDTKLCIDVQYRSKREVKLKGSKKLGYFKLLKLTHHLSQFTHIRPI